MCLVEFLTILTMPLHDKVDDIYDLFFSFYSHLSWEVNDTNLGLSTNQTLLIRLILLERAAWRKSAMDLSEVLTRITDTRLAGRMR